MKSYFVYIFLIALVIIHYLSARPIYKDGDKVRITSVVISDPIVYDKSQYIKLAGLKLYLPLLPEIYYGDRIVVEGTVIDDTLKNPKLIKKEETVSFSSSIRKRIINFYKESLPDPYPGLIAGITLGSKGTLNTDFFEKVKKVGVAHVVVASGTNITFVTSFLVNFLSLFLIRRKMIPLVVLGIILYLFISGFEAPLIRASVMATIVFIAQEKGRLASTWRILTLTALLMLLFKPQWIVDLGFILSFVSTASLILFERKIRERLKFVPQVFKESLSTSVAAQIGVAPILFVTFGDFNIWSPIVNMLVLWTIPLIMIVGTLGGVVGIFIPFLGKFILYLGYPVLLWFNYIVNLFS